MFCFIAQCNQNKSFEKPNMRSCTRIWMTTLGLQSKRQHKYKGTGKFVYCSSTPEYAVNCSQQAFPLLHLDSKVFLLGRTAWTNFKIIPRLFPAQISYFFLYQLLCWKASGDSVLSYSKSEKKSCEKEWKALGWHSNFPLLFFLSAGAYQKKLHRLLKSTMTSHKVASKKL